MRGKKNSSIILLRFRKRKKDVINMNSSRLKLMIEISKLYYLDGLSQNEISKKCIFQDHKLVEFYLKREKKILFLLL